MEVGTAPMGFCNNFIFVFLYWCLYYTYSFSTVIVHHTLRKRYKRDKEKNKSDLEKSNNHFEEDLYVNSQVRTFIGFDTLALFFMLFLIIFVYSILIYFLVCVLGFLLSSIDEALIHIFKIGNEGFVVILTYKVFSLSSGGGVNRLISNNAVRFWRFLNRRGQRDDPTKALQRAIKQLHQTLKAFSDKDKHKYKHSYAMKGFGLKEVDDYLNTASELLTTSHPKDSELEGMLLNPRIACLKVAVAKLQKVFDKCDLNEVAKVVQPIEEWITSNNVKEQTEAALHFCDAIKHLRKSLVKFLVPPMSVSSDKANALLAALVYQNVNTLQLEQSTPPQANPAPQQRPRRPEDSERYRLLLSLIEEDI